MLAFVQLKPPEPKVPLRGMKLSVTSRAATQTTERQRENMSGRRARTNALDLKVYLLRALGDVAHLYITSHYVFSTPHHGRSLKNPYHIKIPSKWQEVFFWTPTSYVWANIRNT